MKLRLFSALNALALLVGMVVTYALPMSIAADGGQVNWEGNGWPNPSCTAATNQTMLWIFTGKGSGGDLTNVVLHWDTGQSVGMQTQGNGSGSFHGITPFFDPTTNGPVFVTFDGALDGNATLTLSGCNEAPGGANSTIVTHVHLGVTDADPLNPITVDNANPATDGDSVHDSAHLTFDGTGALPDGSYVVFYFWNNNTCAGNADLHSDPVAVSGTSPIDLDPEFAQGPLSAGGYAYLAFFFSGDSSVVADSSGDCEPFTINGEQSQTSSVATEVHLGATDSGTPVVVDNANPAGAGSHVHDSATVTFSGGGTLPTGSTVSFLFFENNTCDEGTSTDSSTSADLGGQSSPVSIDPGLAEGPLGPGDYSYTANFTSGDPNAIPSAPGDCEPFKVVKNDVTISTDIHDKDHNVITTASLGDVVHDTATISGTVSGTDPDLSKVTFTWFTNGTCDGTGTTVGNDTAESANVAKSDDSAALAPGDYSYSAVFAGDDNYNASDPAKCEPLHVDKGTLTIGTDIHNSSHHVITSAALGSVVHDTATLGGAVSGFAPDLSKVSFTFYPNKYCTAGTGTAVANGTAEDTNVARSVDSAALAAGGYSYSATFAGDDNYEAVGPATCEPLTINKADLTISTDIHNAAHQVITTATVGDVVHDTAKLTGAVSGFNPDLTKVSFTWFTNGTCYGTGTSVGNGTPESTTVARTVNSAPLGFGSFSYKASFSGDTNYNGTGPSACEPLTVYRAPLTIGYWWQHLANSGKTGGNTSTYCGTNQLKSLGGGCSNNGPWTIQYLPQTLGNYTVANILNASAVFQANNCSNTGTSSNAADCLAAQLLAAELNVANGAKPCGTIATANAFLVSIAYTGPGYVAPKNVTWRSQAVAYATTLNTYNNGGSC